MDTILVKNFSPFLTRLLDDVNRLIGPIHLVGGGLRDCLLGLPMPSELDILVSIPLEICRHRLSLAGYQNLASGNKYNSLLLHLNREEDPHSLSITTLRHRPSQRATVEEDLLHRDITLNAMAFQWPNGPQHDPYHATEDLQHKRIRLVDGHGTLRDDPLRAVRFYRFIIQFQGDPDMDDLALVERQTLESISEERIRSELDKIFTLPLSDDHSKKWFLRLFTSPLGNELLPELQPLRHIYADPGHKESVWDLNLRMLLNIPAPEEGEELTLADLRWCALLHEMGRAKFANLPGNTGHASNHVEETLHRAEALMTVHGFSKRRLRRILNLMPHLDFDIFSTDRALRRLIQNRVPLEGLFRLLKAKRDAASHLDDEERLKLAEKYRRAMRRCQTLRQALQRFSAHDLVLSGGDILDMVRLRPGPWMGKLQEHLITWVTEDPTRNRRELLEKHTWEWISENNLFSSDTY